jgi:hypothetical protein
MLLGCRSSGGSAPDAGRTLRLDCDRLLLEAEIQSVCNAEIASRTASLGEGGTETLCDRKFRTAEGRMVAFTVAHGEPAEQRQAFAARQTALAKLPDHRALIGLGEAAMRFTEATSQGERRTIEVLLGRWRVVLYSGRRTVKGKSLDPLCTLDALELLSKLLVRRLR